MAIAYKLYCLLKLLTNKFKKPKISTNNLEKIYKISIKLFLFKVADAEKDFATSAVQNVK